MPVFWLVRHGETEWNASRIQQGWLDSPLTENGIARAKEVATGLPAETSLLFSSDLGRAQHSAQIIAADLNNPHIMTDWRLRERGFGELEGQPIDKSELDKIFGDEQASHRGAEPVAHMNERIKSFIRDCALLDYDNFVIVAHSGVLNRFGALLIDGFNYVDHENSSIAKYEIDFTDPRLQPATIEPWRPIP